MLFELKAVAHTRHQVVEDAEAEYLAYFAGKTIGMIRSVFIAHFRSTGNIETDDVLLLKGTRFVRLSSTVQSHRGLLRRAT